MPVYTRVFVSKYLKRRIKLDPDNAYQIVKKIPLGEIIAGSQKEQQFLKNLFSK